MPRSVCRLHTIERAVLFIGEAVTASIRKLLSLAAGHIFHSRSLLGSHVQKSRILHKSHPLDGQGLFLCRNDVQKSGAFLAVPAGALCGIN